MKTALDLGSVQLRLILDGYIDIDGNKVFYPATQDVWGAGITLNAAGNLPVVVYCLLISEGNVHTLVDTGFGEEAMADRQESVIKSLAELGVQPKHISRVIITHTHGDHFLGNTLHRAGRWLPAFPLAEYIVQDREITAMRSSGDDMWRTRFQPLAERNQLRCIDGDTQLSNTITCWATPGHTIGHQSVVIRSQGQSAIFMGDLAVHAKLMEHPEWGPDWAWSRQADRESRLKVIEWALKENATIIIAHDPAIAWLRLERAGESYRVAPVNQ